MYCILNCFSSKGLTVFPFSQDAKMSDLKCKINESKKLVGDLNHEKGWVEEKMLSIHKLHK